MNNDAFENTMENVRKQRYKTCDNRKKKLFNIRTRFSYYKIFQSY